jgi:hypothetical protein
MVDAVVMIGGVDGAAEVCAWDWEVPTAVGGNTVVEVHASKVAVGEKAEHSLESASGHESLQG